MEQVASFIAMNVSFIAAFAIASISGLIAKKKGRNFWGYFLLSILVGPALAIIIALLPRKKVKKEPIYYKPPKREETVNVRVDEQRLYRELDMALDFLKAFSTVRPDEWYYFFIYPETEERRYDELFYIYDGFIEFKILVGCWYDNLLYKYPEILDYMQNVYTFDSQENTFIYRMPVGESQNCSFPYKEVGKTLNDYLSKYSENHPNVRFKECGHGAELVK